VEELESSGGFLARRLSGGGAVYHDLGNLNFTFLVPREDYDVERQSEVILRAVRNAGINAVRTGRNDIETEGRKFSGNAFYLSGKNAYHHGTILLNADTEAASKYLSVSQDKIKAKGVESVKSRIINLNECNPDLTIAKLKQLLIESFAEVYGCRGETLDQNGLDRERLAALEKEFSDPLWKYGKNPPFSFEASGRFPWGGVEIRIDAKENRIQNCVIFSDAMDEAFTPALSARLSGAAFTRQGAVEAAAAANWPPEWVSHAEDIINLIFNL
jgi:lipoate-protein ligase A